MSGPGGAEGCGQRVAAPRKPHFRPSGCAFAGRQAEQDRGKRPSQTSEEGELKPLERESCELQQANEILRKASSYFARAELDRWSKS